jgi:type II secretory pathway component GspD/PulD (secretin)
MFRGLLFALAVLVLSGPVFSDALQTGSAPSLVTRAYDVRDLINGALVSDMPAPDLCKPQSDVDDATAPATPEEIQQEIITKVQNTVAKSTWATVPAMKFQDDTLVVQQTPAVQDKVAMLLSQLRNQKHAKISVEAEYVEITSAARHDISFLSRASKGKYGSLSGDDAKRLESAVRSDPSINVTSARIDVDNGRGGYAFAGSNLRYVHGYDRIATDAAPRYQPQIASRGIGILFNVERAMISADNQHVTLDLRFQQSRLQQVKSQAFDQASELHVQMPMIDVEEVRSRVTVAQDGYILLGGLNDSRFILVHAVITPVKQ